jgi:hypothetical protein
MKYVKILGLAAMALAALMAMAGTASATTLTSPKGSTYTSNIVATSEGNVTLTSVFGGFGAVTCSHSEVIGKVEKHGTGVTVSGKISSLTFTGCTGGEVTSPVATPGSLEIHNISGSPNGLLTSSGAEIIIHKTAFGTCTFKTGTGTSLGTLTGSTTTGGNATLDISAVIPSACGNGTWEGSYKVLSPAFLDVDA